MDDSVNNDLLCFLVRGHSRDSNGYYNVTASWVPYHIHTTLCDHSPCAELGLSTPHNTIYSNSITIVETAKKQTNEKRYPDCLAHAVSGMFYCVGANQRQPQYTYNFYGVGANRGQLLYIYTY